MNFTLENLESAKTTYEKIKRKIIEIKQQEHKGNNLTKSYKEQFLKAINDDLNMPLAVQIFHKALDDFDFSPKKKLILLEKFDNVLGLGIKDFQETQTSIPEELKKLLEERERLRKNKLWKEADIVRQRIKEKGYKIEDTSQGPKLKKLS